MLQSKYNNYFSDIGAFLSQTQEIDRLFQTWHYNPTILPLLDNQTPYEHIEKKDDAIHEFRVIDSNREVLLVRADSTLFLAHIISKHIDSDLLPLRVCYSNNVVRTTAYKETHEIWQNGIELIGVPSIAGDFEILLLTYKALQLLAPNMCRIHIGSKKIVQEVILSCNPSISPTNMNIVLDAILYRDIHTIIQYTNEEVANAILTIMEVSELNSHKSMLLKYLPSSQALDEYVTLIETLAQIIPQECIRCDFSEVGIHKYYTHIVFSAYAIGKPDPVALGGRYDSLMEQLGTKVPAVGATISPMALMSYILQNNNTPLDTASVFSPLTNATNPSVEALLQCVKETIKDRL